GHRSILQQVAPTTSGREESGRSRRRRESATETIPSYGSLVYWITLSAHWAVIWSLEANYRQNRTEANMASLPLATAEACDANAGLILNGDLRALQPIFRIYGGRQIFAGPVVTLKIFEDNVLLREFLEEKGHDRVLVVDAGGSMRCAVLGGNLAQLAQNNGWAGIVINGCIRDVDEINGCDVGVRALNSHPIKSNKKGVGEKHVPVTFAGTRICDGEWLYADSDGILLSTSELTV
ncbi:unnamed protein product, partial [Urochloa humidicola]